MYQGSVGAVKFNCAGDRMATGGEDGKVIVWNLAIPRQDGNGGEELGAKECPKRSKAAGAEGLLDDELKGGGTALGKIGVRGTSVGSKRASATAESMSSAARGNGGVGPVGRESSDLGLGGLDGKKDSSSELEVFCSAPVRVYSEHKGDVVDLSWSPSGFLCSASTDGTVKLWHPSSCVCFWCSWLRNRALWRDYVVLVAR